ncbi:universal stress protein [Pseudomonas sp. UL073]|uniref:Universal stress protein n=1 Tax=Zestomonas insulae TaxID=2809017 RepID=A0ABS2IGE4_9GAMM|nr:universal stress protein [Pseudomonas insulae]MBM7062141.1 universal stress protein [Pseudomonas insulae]
MANPIRLLAATDLSVPARQAVRRAALQAAECGGRLDLLHVIERALLERLKQLAGGMPMGLSEQMKQEALRELSRLAESVHGAVGVSAGLHVTCGSVLSEIEAQSEQRGTDVLVVAGRGESYLRHRLLGSTAERMVGKSRRSILVVKQPARTPYRTLLVPVDFSVSSLPSLRTARALAPDAEVVLLHAFDVPFERKLRFGGIQDEVIEGYRAAARQDALARLQGLCEQAQLPMDRVRLLVVRGDASRCVIEQEQEQMCDLIVVGKHGESQLEDLLLGSTTRYVLQESQCDVLVTV